jgi:hypothetical protein
MSNVTRTTRQNQSMQTHNHPAHYCAAVFALFPAMSAVSLDLTLVSAGVDRSAVLFFRGEGGKLQRYHSLLQGEAVRQPTHPGHKWLLRGDDSGKVLLRITAQAEPAVQWHRVDIDGLDVPHERAPAPTVAHMPDHPELPSHSRSPFAKKRRRQLRREKRREQALLSAASEESRRSEQVVAAVSKRPEPAVHGTASNRLERAKRVAFARGVRAAKAVAKERRGAKRLAKKQSKATVQAAQRSARRRKASGL